MGASLPRSVAILAALLAARQAAGALFVTADADVRARAFAPDPGVALEVAGLAVRRVFQDSGGDRVIVFALVEGMRRHGEEGWRSHVPGRVVVDQAYARWKGPLGAWNATGGRYLVPFGLLGSYSSSRLLVRTLEFETAGVESDNGVMLSGFVGSLDWAASASTGTGMDRWWSRDGGVLVTARAGINTGESEGMRPGVSVAWGKAAGGGHGMEAGPPVMRRIGAVDLTWYSWLATVRAEASAGERDGGEFRGLFLEADAPVLPGLEVFVSGDPHRAGEMTGGSVLAGVTASVAGLQVRAAWGEPFNREENHELLGQVYWTYSLTR